MDEIDLLVELHFNLDDEIKFKQIIKDYDHVIKGRTTASLYHNLIKHIWKKKQYNLNDGQIILRNSFKIYDKLVPNRSALRKKLSEIRQIIKANQNEKQIYKSSINDNYFNMTEKDRVKLINDYQSKILQNNNDKISIYVNEIETKTMELLLSDDAFKKVVALLVITGARTYELLYKNDFKKVNDNDSLIQISNIAKKREGQADKKIERPILFISAKKALKDIKSVRKELNENYKVINDNCEVSKSIMNRLNREVVSAFPFTAKMGNKSSFLRKIYANIAYLLHGDPKKVNKNTYISNILGHDGLLTSFSYSNIEVYKTRPKEHIEKVKINKQSSKEDKFKILDEIMKKYNNTLTKSDLMKKAKMGRVIIDEYMNQKI